MHYALNRKSIYAQLQTFPIIISDPEQDPLKRIAFNRSLSEPHKRAADLELKSKLGAIPYMESVIENMPIGQSIRRMCAEAENVYCLT